MSGLRKPATQIVVYDGTREHGREPYTLECRRCGVTQTTPTPIAGTAFVMKARAFERQHRACPPKT